LFFRQQAGNDNYVMSRVTLKEIARLAGVSTITASRALRNLTNVAPDTRQRIQKIAEAQGYVPDPALQALVAYRTNQQGAPKNPPTLALLHLESESSPSAEWTHAITISGAWHEAERLGYRIDELHLGTTEKQQSRTREILLARGIRGILFPPGIIPQKLYINLDAFSCVLMNHGIQKTGFHAVQCDPYQLTLLAVEELLKHGARRLLFMGGSPSERPSSFRALGAFSQAKHLFPDLSFTTTVYDRDLAEFIPWCRKKKPDAVLSVLGQEHFNLLRQAGFQPGKTIRCMGINLQHPPEDIASVSADNHAVGQASLRKLHDMLLHDNYGPPEHRQVIHIQGKLLNESALISPGV